MQDRPLHDRNILITGASSGLGAHFAQLCARAGGHVVLGARRADRLKALVDEIERDGGKASAVTLDVADEASIASGFEQAEALAGPVRTVIANAGISATGSAVKVAAEDFDAMFDVNVRGVFLTAREAARRMIAAGTTENRIVLISSIGGLVPLAGLAGYSASKAAVVMLGQSLAREWINKGINVNILCPGYIRTELNGEWFDSEGGIAQVARFPRRRLMPPHALDELLLYLSGPQSAYVTGSVFKVDDGQSLP
jgi:NAD(P)-dependent dehydrogenase (short-subunit alcohol dehydrogenase family)